MNFTKERSERYERVDVDDDDTPLAVRSTVSSRTSGYCLFVGSARTKKTSSSSRWIETFLGLILIFLMIREATTTNAHPEIGPGCPIYNEDEALEYVFYSKVAFCTEHAITTWSCGDMCEKSPIVGVDKIRYIPEGEKFGVQGYVAQIPGGEATTPTTRVSELKEDDDLSVLEEASPATNSSSSINDNDDADESTDDDTDTNTRCIVSFRGSLNTKNWLADFSLILQDWPLNNLTGAGWCSGCKAHYGFTEAYEELRDSVHIAVDDLGCTSLVLAGHSLGAAVATIASFDLRESSGHHVEATWTFGKPRIGNDAFVDALGASAASQGVAPPVWRVIHYHDIVPRAIPRIPALNEVAHGALEVYYTDRASSEYLVCPQVGSAENRSRFCMGGFPLVFSLNKDHVSYLNQSFAFKDFPEECKAVE